MKWRIFVPLLVALLANSLAPGTALAGVEPSPFHVVFTNRTNLLEGASPFYNSALYDLTLVLVVESPESALTKVAIPIAATVAPGETIAFLVNPADYPQLAGALIAS